MPVPSAPPPVTPAVGLPVLGAGGAPGNQTGSFLVTPGWFGAGLLCDLGHVAFPLWDSVSSVQCRGELALVSSPPGDRPVLLEILAEQKQERFSVPYPTPASGRLHIFVRTMSVVVLTSRWKHEGLKRKYFKIQNIPPIACHSSAPSPLGPHLPRSRASHSCSCFHA